MALNVFTLLDLNDEIVVFLFAECPLFGCSNLPLDCISHTISKEIRHLKIWPIYIKMWEESNQIHRSIQKKNGNSTQHPVNIMQRYGQDELGIFLQMALYFELLAMCLCRHSSTTIGCRMAQHPRSMHTPRRQRHNRRRKLPFVKRGN